MSVATLPDHQWNNILTKFSVLLQIATIIAVYADWSFAKVKGIGWGWAGVIWLYSIVFYFPLDLMKFAIRYILSGKAWVNLLENKVYMYWFVSFLSITVKAFMTVIWIGCFKICHRLPSPPRKTTVGRRGKLSGLMLRGPCMDFNHQKLLAFSMRRTVIENSQRLRSRPWKELKLQGKPTIPLCLWTCEIYRKMSN